MTATEIPPTEGHASRALIFTRVLDAPVARVFAAWTEPAQMAQWWGPHGFTNPLVELDVRPGGAMRIHMQGPDGMIYPMTGVFEDVAQPDRLVFSSTVLDDKGGTVFEGWNSVELKEEKGRTTLTLRARITRIAEGAAELAAQYLQGMEAGWTQSLERLETQVNKK